MEQTRFWSMVPEMHELTQAETYGAETVAIVDEETGGIILYCHEDSAERIINALVLQVEATPA